MLELENLPRSQTVDLILVMTPVIEAQRFAAVQQIVERDRRPRFQTWLVLCWRALSMVGFCQPALSPSVLRVTLSQRAYHHWWRKSAARELHR